MGRLRNGAGAILSPLPPWSSLQPLPHGVDTRRDPPCVLCACLSCLSLARTVQDDSHLSLTIALNSRGEYEGGGTFFEESGCVLRPDCGGVVCFPGSLRHGGHTVTSGVRYIIAAFLWVEGLEGVWV